MGHDRSVVAPPALLSPLPTRESIGHSGRLSFAAGSSADDGSPGAWAGHRGREKNVQFGKDRPWNGSTSHVARLVSRTAAESRQQRWHLLDNSPIAPPPRRADSSVMTSRPGCTQRSMFNTHSRLRLLACDIDFHTPFLSCHITSSLHRSSSLAVRTYSLLALHFLALTAFSCLGARRAWADLRHSVRRDDK